LRNKRTCSADCCENTPHLHKNHFVFTDQKIVYLGLNTNENHYIYIISLGIFRFLFEGSVIFCLSPIVNPSMALNRV
jgi:hypothetical protein